MFHSNEYFLVWCHKNSLPEATIELITHIRNSPPARRVKAGYKNVSGFFSSKKMGLTIQFESHKNELARIYNLEENKEVIEYYDQPNQIYFNYDSINGKRIGVNHIPDFFVIYEDSAGWEECKTEEDLLKLEEQNPNRYCRDSEGNWRCPPGEAYAQKIGLFYNVVSSKNISWNFLNNTEFFEDYYRAENLSVENYGTRYYHFDSFRESRN
ncbi:MAG: TnsA endonuclease N-terminal domain-containing protein [Pyrinomonadaceae bacterium]